MSGSNQGLDAALDWLTATPENALSFRQRFESIHDAVDGLSEADLVVLRAIHRKGLTASISIDQAEVMGMRSYGWSDLGPPGSATDCPR